MKKVIKILSLFLCLCFFMVPIKASSHTHSGYSHDSSVNLNKSNWMSGLSDNLTMNELSIPGTHDSMAYGNHTDFTLTQSMDLETQLKSGIRFIDLSVKNNGELNLGIHKDMVYLGYSLNDVIKTISEFLNRHQEEVVLVKISEYGDKTGNFASEVQRTLEKSGYSQYIFDGSNTNNPTLGEARGQIIILSDYSGKRWKTIPYSQNARIQDSNYLSTNWDLYSKWEKVKKHLTDTNNSHSKSTRYINYLNGHGGVLPYFVASGHSSSGTGDSRLLTGLTEPGFKSYYPDFPRVSRFGIFSSIAFEGTNVLTLNYIVEKDVRFTGIVVSDFPGAGLIEEIIDLNYKTNSSSNNTSGSGNNSGSSSSTTNKDGWGFTFMNS